MMNGRNWYSTMFDRHRGEHGQWIVVYAYGDTLEMAVEEGFHVADVSDSKYQELIDDGLSCWEAAGCIATGLNRAVEREMGIAI